MTDEQITALAQEYAKATTPYDKDEFYYEAAFRNRERAFRKAIKWLSARFCIVEKSKIEVEKERCDKLLDNAMADPEKHFTTIARVGGRLALLETLFPELFKDKEQ